MPFPMLVRLGAYGHPDAVAAWRERLTTAPGLIQLHRDPVAMIKLAAVRVDTVYGATSADLPHLRDLAAPGVGLIVLWQDRTETRHWLHLQGEDITDIDVPGRACAGLLLAHGGKFRHADTYTKAWPTAAEAMAADASPIGGARRRFITFDLEGPWTPGTHPAPAGTTWADGALDVTDLELGRSLATRPDSDVAPWSQWTVDALSAWLDHNRARACDVPGLVASTAGLPADDLAPLLAERREPATQVIQVIRTLVQQGTTIAQLADVVPVLLA